MSIGLACPKCGQTMFEKPMKNGGTYHWCDGQPPHGHKRVTVMANEPLGEDASTAKGGANRSGERDSGRASSPPASSKVSSRAAALLARSEKLK